MRSRMVMVLAPVFVTCAAVASAQPAAPRFELGGQLSTLRLSDFNTTNLGLGGRVSYGLLDWLTAEGEFDLFPNDDITLASGPFQTNDGRILEPDLRITYRRKRAEAFFGAKMGVRGERMGVFAKLRPGFTHLTYNGFGCGGEMCALVLLAKPEYRTEFALDLGAVFEFYPTQRLVTRVDLSDVFVRHRSQAPPCFNRQCDSHNFASRFGVGWRF